MLSFLKHIGVAIVAGFTAFTGALHNQPTIAPATISTTTESSIINGTVSDVQSSSTENEVKKSQPLTENKTAVASKIANMNTDMQSVQTIPASTNYYSYQNLPSDFSKNPPFYIGTKIKLTGRVVDFMAAGDRGGSSNYIEIALNTGENVPYFALLISANNYQNVVENINQNDTVTAFGVVSPSRNFLNADQFTTSLMPVLNVARLDLCSGANSCTIAPGAHTIFPIVTAQNILSTEDIVSLGNIFLNSHLYIGNKVTTDGKVIRILQSDTDSNSLVFIQDPNDGRGLGFFIVDSAYLINNQIKIGSRLKIKGVLIAPGDSTVANVVNEYHLLNLSGFYITNGTISLE